MANLAGVEHWMIGKGRKADRSIKLRIPQADPILVRLRGLSSVVARGRAQTVS